MRKYQILGLAVLLVFTLRSFGQDLENIGKTNPFKINGNVSLTTGVYGFHSDSLKPRGNPFTSLIAGNFNASIYGVSLPFSFSLGTQDHSYRQPFNQFGLTPKYKWVKAYIGYNTMNFSPYTLADHSFYGCGVELNPNKIRFAVMYGRLNRKIDQLDANRNVIPIFTRNGFSSRIGYGTEKNHIDFIVLKAADDKNSITRPVDSTNTPAANLTTGISSRLNSGKLFFETDMALSAFTLNLNDTNKVSDRFYRSMLNTNASTSQASAINASLAYKEKFYGIKVKYTRIDPKFQSMGAYFLSNDYENITIVPNASLWKKKLMLNASAGFQRNNLNNDVNTTSIRKIGSANFSFNPNRMFSLTGNYANYASDQKAGKIPLVDTMRVYQVNQNMMLMPRLTFVDTAKVQVFMLMVNSMWLQDKNPTTAKYTNFNTNNVLLNYSRTKIRSGLTINAGINYNLVKLSTGENRTYGITWGFSKSFLKNKLTTTFSNVLNKSSYSGVDGLVMNFIAGAAYALSSHNSFNINLNYNGNYTKSSQNPSFREFRGEFCYLYRFGK